MLTYFSINKIFVNQQYGFMKGQSTTDAAVRLISHIINAWEKSYDAIAIFCDLSKAFDCVDHCTLLAKLTHYGLTDRALKLIKSYLEARLQKVQINGAHSEGSHLQMGVPQGSILGPLLFLVYINDLPLIVKNLCEIVLFADDTSLIFKVSRRNPDIDEVNSTLSQVFEWFCANNLALNPNKTKCLKFSLQNVKSTDTNNIKLNDVTLEYVNKTMFLGLTIDSKLQWGPHILCLTKKLSSAAFAVRKIRDLTDVKTARLIYFSNFHSHMSYGILLWGRAADINIIFILQKRAIRAMYNLSSRTSLRQLFKEINIMTVPGQYIYENIMYVRKNIHRFTKNKDIHSVNTRNKNKLAIEKYRLSKTSKCYIGVGVRMFNKLPDEVINLPEKKFKTYVKRVLCKKAYYSINDYFNDNSAWVAVS